MKRTVKMMFSLVSIMLIVAMVLTGCGSKPADKPADGAKPAETAEKKIKIALNCAGMLGDKSFNDSALEGLKKAQAKWPNVEYKVFEAKSAADWEPNLIASSSGGYDLVIVISGQQKDVLAKVAPQFPNQKYAAVDINVGDTPNVVSTLFAQNEGSFLAGAAAAMFTTKTEIPGVNDKKIVGWVGGKDIPVLQDFLVGYKQGVKYIDPQTEVLVAFAGSFTDPLKGKELTNAQYSQGADIVMNVASGTGNGILEAAEENKLYAIGVDRNQDNDKPGFILTSMMKNVDQAVVIFIQSIVENTYQGGKVLYLDIKNGGVGLTDMSVMKQKLGDKFPEDILAKIVELTEEVKSGKIKVDEHPGLR